MAHLLGQGVLLPARSNSTSLAISIRPPSTGEDDRSESDEDSSEEEEEARPLSRDELTARTIRGLHKREANEAKYREQRRNKRLVANKGQL